MGFIRFVVAAVVVIVIVTTDVEATAEATARQQQQFYDDQIFPQQQNSFSNYFRPNHMMNQLNRRRPLNHRNTPISAFASYPDADQAKNIFGFGFGFGGGLTTNFLTTTTTTTATYVYTYTCTRYTSTACRKKKSIVEDDDGDTSQIEAITMEELEAAKKKREADPDYLIGPMYSAYSGSRYNYDDIQSTLGHPYYPNYRDAEPPFFYDSPYYPSYNDEPYSDQGGRLFFFWVTYTSTYYTTSTSTYSSTPSCSTTSSYLQC